MANKENLPPTLTTPPLSKISPRSPSNRPALGRQRDHSACRGGVADTPLKVRKTRENLKQASLHDTIPPPCAPCTHDHKSRYNAGGATQLISFDALNPNVYHGEPPVPTQETRPEYGDRLSPHRPTTVQRQKSMSRRVFSKVKEGIASRPKSFQSVRPTGSETSLARRLSGRRKQSDDIDRRAHSFELSRYSIDSTPEEESSVLSVLETTPSNAQRSFTDSTVSTSEILEDLVSIQIPTYRISSVGDSIKSDESASGLPSTPASASPDQQPTPRPLLRAHSHRLAATEQAKLPSVPSVALEVATDATTVDFNSKRNIWISITATVIVNDVAQSHVSSTHGERHPHTHLGSGSQQCGIHDISSICGSITSLRLCFKLPEGCRFRSMIGQKTYKDVKVGDKCMLFLKIGVPKLHAPSDAPHPDQESLFAELESIVGTLETDVLYVEARYRHSLLPRDNIVAVKQTCRILRPKTESRWSINGLFEQTTEAGVHAQLAKYLTDHYTPDEALELLYHYFDFDTRARPGLAEICSTLQRHIELQQSASRDTHPAVVVTDIDVGSPGERDPDDGFATAPSTPISSNTLTLCTDAHSRLGSSSSLTSARLAPPTISASKTTTALSTPVLSSSPPMGTADSESQDSARQIWHHIRRTSQSSRQLDSTLTLGSSFLDPQDGSLQDLRRRALANKRSIGAETLRTWKWEEEMQSKERPAEAPWM